MIMTTLRSQNWRRASVAAVHPGTISSSQWPRSSSLPSPSPSTRLQEVVMPPKPRGLQGRDVEERKMRTMEGQAFKNQERNGTAGTGLARR
ncbi:uncharacterized [Tachysurus ichikawai]